MVLLNFVIMVSLKEWKEKAKNLSKWRDKRTSALDLSLYKSLVNYVSVGERVLDVGAGQCHLKKVLPSYVKYKAIDPFPLSDNIVKSTAEDLIKCKLKFDTVFMLAALDNVISVEKSLLGLRHVAERNIVILTGIDIPVDIYHTHKINRQDLVNVLGEPSKEIKMLPNVYLFEWML
jgi:hypothetical protein